MHPFLLTLARHLSPAVATPAITHQKKVKMKVLFLSILHCHLEPLLPYPKYYPRHNYLQVQAQLEEKEQKRSRRKSAERQRGKRRNGRRRRKRHREVSLFCCLCHTESVSFSCWMRNCARCQIRANRQTDRHRHTHTHTHTHKHTHTQTKYGNPCCAYAPRVNKALCIRGQSLTVFAVAMFDRRTLNEFIHR